MPLLDAVFSEEALAGGVGLKDGFGGVGFADGHERDGGGVAVGTGAGGGDLVAELLEVCGDGHGSDPVYGAVDAGFILGEVGFWWPEYRPCIQLAHFPVLGSEGAMRIREHSARNNRR